MHRSEVEFQVSGFDWFASAFENTDFLEHLYEGEVVCFAVLKKEQSLCINEVVRIAEGFKSIIIVSLINLLAKQFRYLRDKTFTSKEF